MSSSPETIGTPMKRCAGFKIGLSSRPSRRRISAIQFGFGHGGGAHAPDEYYLIESKNPKIHGIDGAVRGHVEFLYEFASMS